jgi:1-acyl-sn-glycerol-3-phosphate acyltransferase
MPQTAFLETPTVPPAVTGHGTGPLQLWRGCRLISVFAWGAVRYAWSALTRRDEKPLLRRARWMHSMSIAFIDALGIQPTHAVRALPPGLVVSNHLSYLDIVTFGSIAPCVMVSKSEVASWPVIGFFARMAGTIFIDRTRRSDLVRVNAEIEAALAEGLTVVLFPEGTSSDGREVLPLKPSVLEPVASTARPVTAAALSYFAEDASVADEVCYWRDMTFFPHLLNLMTKRTVRVDVALGRTGTPVGSRKELAVSLREEISTLQAGLGRQAWSCS